MRGKDITNSANFKARAGRGVCSVVSRVSDLAARGIADNQKNNSHNNQEIRIAVQGFIEMGRNVAPEILEFHRKERQTPHSQFCLLELSLCFIQVKVSQGSKLAEVLSYKFKFLESVCLELFFIVNWL